VSYTEVFLLRKGLLTKQKGGMNMIEQTIKAVKEAEARASQTIADAWNQADTIRKQSGETAERIIKEAEESDRENARTLLQKARENGERETEEAKAAAEEKARQIASEASPRVSDAIAAVISEIVK